LVASTNASQSSTTWMWESRNSVARASIAAWISSRIPGMDAARPVSGSDSFSPVMRRATSATPFSRSRGPIAMRSGTPRISWSLNLKPIETCGRSST
jgi:hypothetical protein